MSIAESNKGKILLEPYIHFGCDPEIFLQRDGRIVGAERVIPVKGIANDSYYHDAYTSGVVLDGVQAELNTQAHACRAHLGNEIKSIFQALRSRLRDVKDFTVNFQGVVEVDAEELAALSEKARVLGCAPSNNLYDAKASITVDAAVYRKRSAGGHIHLGLDGIKSLMAERVRIVPLLDAIVGNTCVMIDRDPGAAERRKVYGRAGEYRLPKHGLEYRTLSNFWLRSYPLMSFVTGMSRVAAGVLYTTLYNYSNSWNAEHELLSKVDIEAVREAINTNNFDLAKENYKVVRDFLVEHNSGQYGEPTGLWSGVMDKFDYFVDMIQQKGLEYWFPDDPIEHWCNMPEGHDHGWESWLQKNVKVPARMDEVA